VVNRCCQKVYGTGLVAIEFVPRTSVGGREKDNGRVASFWTTSHQLGHFDAVHFRHVNIEQDKEELSVNHHCQRFVAEDAV
jgi:hypothetical protein